MMKFNQVLAITTIPILLSTLAFASINQTDAADTNQIMAQNQPTQQKDRQCGPDFAAAATKLGVTEQQFKDALGKPPLPDFAAAATKLGVTQQQLKDALGLPENISELPEGEKPQRPDFEAAATKLGITFQQLKEALGKPPLPDFAAAAAKLGVTEQQFKDALGFPENPPKRPE